MTKIPLDYENKTHYSFTVGVKDCSLSGNISECGNVTHIKDPSSQETINVTVRVVDENDNPPVFKVKEISVGMRRKTEVNTTLDISLKVWKFCFSAQEIIASLKTLFIFFNLKIRIQCKCYNNFQTSDYIEDKDTDENGRHAWVFTNAGDIQTSSSLDLQSGVMNCTDKKRVSSSRYIINKRWMLCFMFQFHHIFNILIPFCFMRKSDASSIVTSSQKVWQTTYLNRSLFCDSYSRVLFCKFVYSLHHVAVWSNTYKAAYNDWLWAN